MRLVTISLAVFQWLCQTIFVRLVKEIDAVNAGLRRHGLSEVQIGKCSHVQLFTCSAVLAMNAGLRRHGLSEVQIGKCYVQKFTVHSLLASYRVIGDRPSTRWHCWREGRGCCILVTLTSSCVIFVYDQ